MPPFLKHTIARIYMSPDEGSGGGWAALDDGAKAALADMGVESESEFNALRPEDKAALLAETPDDTTPLTIEPGAPTATPEPTAPPAATPVPTPQPTAAPAATPQPTAAPAPGAAPAATPAPAWRAVDAADDSPIALPALDAPVQVVRADDGTKETELTSKLEALFDKFAEGEISKDEYATQKRVLDTELREVSGRVAAQAAVDAQYAANASKAWQSMVGESFRIAKESGGIDYEAADAQPQRDALDAAVRRLAQAAPLMHPDKPPVWRDRWALLEAHKQTAVQFGKAFTMPAASPAPAPGAPAAKPRAAPNLSGVPPTLAGAPEAAAASVQGDEFAHLDTLTPAQAEKEVARFDPAKMERYLAR